MTRKESSKLATKLMKERSRETLLHELGAAMEEMTQEQMASFLADLFLTIGADRDHLKERLASLLATQFGRRSEKSSPDQLDLFAEVLKVVAAGGLEGTTEDEDDPAVVATQAIEQTNAEIAALAAEKRAKKKAEREARRAAMRLEKADDRDAVPWPTHLPIREERLELPEADRMCADLDCDKAREIFRYETSWRLEQKTTTSVVVTYLPVAACPNHHGGPVMTPVPPKPVDNGQMGFSLGTRLLWLRITHNLPVRRLAEICQSDGAPISESMIHTLIRVSGERVKPLVEAIHRKVQAATLINLDDTHTDVYLGHRGKRERRRSRVWLALGDEKYAYFFATKTWEAKEAKAALGSFSGVLQGDGYRGFPKYAREQGARLAGCMAHLRRKLRAAVKAKDPRASYPLALVQGMYRVEELARLQDLDVSGRLALRQERSLPMMQALIEWAQEVEAGIVTGSPLGKAWTYLSNQLGPLQVFLTDGSVSIDNNAAERGLRRLTIGRKLWLFFRGQAKLEHVSRLMSVLYTARLHGADEQAYLSWVLEQFARREWSAEAASALMPDAWLALQEQEAKESSASRG